MNNTNWENDIPMTKKEIKTIYRLRKAGCKCRLPLLGEVNGLPRCRLCNVDVRDERLPRHYNIIKKNHIVDANKMVEENSDVASTG